MNKTSSKLIFFGSGPLGLASLASLSRDFEIEAVITKPQVHSRDQTPVIDFAKSKSIPCLVPATRPELEKIFKENSWNSSLGVVVDYGLIIPVEVINSFRLGIVNSHFSLLPEWRGADPITFAILSGQNKTGVSLMLIEPQMDTGPLLAQTDVGITHSDTSETLTDKLITASNNMLRVILPIYVAEKVTPMNQQLATINTLKSPLYSRKLSKADGLLDFNKPATHLEREIRAYAKWPKSHTELGGKDVIVTKASIDTSQDEPGKITATSDGEISISTGLGSLIIKELKPASKPVMSAKAFLAGNSLG
jgi:methionyl-tRNA formyltransferase